MKMANRTPPANIAILPRLPWCASRTIERSPTHLREHFGSDVDRET
jgi:hypothetical protein